jgi:hypothetical protein
MTSSQSRHLELVGGGLSQKSFAAVVALDRSGGDGDLSVSGTSPRCRQESMMGMSQMWQGAFFWMPQVDPRDGKD